MAAEPPRVQSRMYVGPAGHDLIHAVDRNANFRDLLSRAAGAQPSPLRRVAGDVAAHALIVLGFMLAPDGWTAYYFPKSTAALLSAAAARERVHACLSGVP